MLNNKINFLIAHLKTKAATSPDLRVKPETLAFGPSTPNNTPNSSYERIESTVNFYFSPSSSSESDSKATYSTTPRRYTF